MPADLPQREERRGTRHVFLGAAIVAILLVIGGVIWPLVTSPQLPNPSGYPESRRTDNAANGERSNQSSGASTVGRSQPNEPANQAGMKARAIEASANPLALSTEQRRQLRDYFANQQANKADNVSYTISVGASVPREAKLAQLPSGVSDILHGYSNDQYVLVGGQLVIVDAQARRIVAIVPGVS